MLTPLHVGSGRELIRDIDYVRCGAIPRVLDQEALYRALESGEKDLRSLPSKLTDLAEVAGCDLGYDLPSYPRGKVIDAGRIREQEKDALLHPLLPGSSLMGAIRTALFAHAIETGVLQNGVSSLLPTRNPSKQKASVPPKSAAARLTETVFSPDAGRGQRPNFDILRALKVGDALFSSDQLCLIDVRWMNLGFKGAGWRSMSSRRTVPNWREADGLVAEAAQPRSRASFALQVDEFLPADPLAGQVLGADFQSRASGWFGSFEALREILNGHSIQRLQSEAAFFRTNGVSEAEKRCRQILKEIEQQPEGIYLQIGWGNGWRGMTGDWMDEQTEQEMRSLYRLGRNGAPFPKTRRLAVNGSGPSAPLGWVRLHTPENSRALEEQAADQRRAARAKEEEQRRKREEEDRAAAERQARRDAMSPLQREMEEIELRGGDNPGAALLQALEQGKWDQADERRRVAERIRSLWEQGDKRIPDFGGTNKQKVKQRDRCLKVQEWLFC
ncbi:MAG: RAMP superfamily CRISPR-associated protein [Pseudomonadota bacterium]|nr:RAMP superfamily CRISPR-associated protein [Pseudomonadota bacterium]